MTTDHLRGEMIYIYCLREVIPLGIRTCNFTVYVYVQYIRAYSDLSMFNVVITIIYYLSQHGLRPLCLTIVFNAVILRIFICPHSPDGSIVHNAM